jgi:hypothetical protein
MLQYKGEGQETKKQATLQKSFLRNDVTIAALGVETSLQSMVLSDPSEKSTAVAQQLIIFVQVGVATHPILALFYLIKRHV